MPFSSLCRPLISLGLLQAGLDRHGIKSQTIYANLDFAEFIGFDVYRSLFNVKPEDGLLEWIFASAAFPEQYWPATALVPDFCLQHGLTGEIQQQEVAEKFEELRCQALGFLEHIGQRVSRLSPAIICCSSVFSQHTASLALLRKIKSTIPGIITILGGPNCEGVMGATTHAEFSWLDYVVSGEADDFFPDLVSRLLDDYPVLPETDLPHGVFGPQHRIVSGTRQARPAVERAVTGSMNTLPVPNYDDYFKSLDAHPGFKDKIIPGLIFEGSRGCWWGEKRGCTFCGLNGQAKRFRKKGAEQILEELGELSQRYGLHRFEATDNILAKEFFHSLLPRLKEQGAPYNLFYETKSSLSESQVKLLRESGVIWIQPGIESLSSKALRLMNKGCMAWQNIALLKYCQLYGVRTTWSIMYGFPGEKDIWFEEMAAILPLLSHLQPPMGANRVRHDRFSHYFDNQQRYNLMLEPVEPFARVYPVDPGALNNLVYFFEDRPTRCLEQNPIMAVLLARSGAKKVQREIAEWRTAFYSEERPRLEYRCTGDAIEIHDTRSCRWKKAYKLDEVESRIFLLCTQHPTHKSFRQQAGHNETAVGRWATSLAGLIDRKLVLDIDRRFVGLPIPEPFHPLPSSEDFPGGFGP